MVLTDHELNVKTAELLGWKWKGSGLVLLGTRPNRFIAWHESVNARAWSPATSIENATELLKLLPKRNRGSYWIVKVLYRCDSVDVDLLGRPDPEGDREAVWARHDITYGMLPRALTEAHIVAMEASK